MRDVLDATVEALAHAGYVALSFEDVAARAGVSRTTIYRRWPTKQDLVRAALLRFAEEHHGASDTGSLREDLRCDLCDEDKAEQVRLASRLMRAMMAELGDPELQALARLALERALQPHVAAVERAVARGELPAGTDPAAVLEPIVFTSMMRTAVFGEEPSPERAERLIDLVLAGARAGAASRRGP